VTTQKFIGRAFRVFAVTGVLAMLGSVIGTAVDAVIVGNAVGEGGLAALNVALPIYMFYNMLSFTLGVGGSTKTAVALGGGDVPAARRVFTLTVLLGLLLGMVVSGTSELTAPALLHLMGGEALPPDCLTYLSIILRTAPIFIVAPVLNLMLRSDADPRLAAAGIAISVAVTLILDLLLIVWLGLGLLGAGLAMAAGQLAAVVTYLFHFARRNHSLTFCKVRAGARELGSIFAGGFGSGSVYVYQCVYILVFNVLLMRVSGAGGVAVFSAVLNLGLFASATFDGISLSLPPLAGTFLGERDRAGVVSSLSLALKAAVLCGALWAVLMVALAGPLVSAFGIPHLAGPGGQALRLYALGFVFAGANTVMGCYYQTIGRRALSVVISLLRCLALMLGLGIPLVLRLGAAGAGLAYAGAELLTLLVWLAAALAVKRRAGLDSLLLLPREEAQGRVYEAMLGGDPEELTRVLTEVEQFSGDCGLDPVKGYYTSLTIEELAGNIQTFGFTDGKPHYISVKVAVYGEDVYVRLRDDATDYNPFENRRDSVDEMVETDELELLGVSMVAKAAKSFDYQRRLVFNNLLVKL
jgi:Na+-driven multidrug efflux pump/anti-sigma regulatory factor (Ser/Thr protein kinase)